MLPSFVTRLERLHHLINYKATGNPKQLCYRLHISERSLYDYISLLKELGAPVRYDRFRETYLHEQRFEFSIRF